MKNINKIGLSLLIALAFLMPSAAVFAGNSVESSEAGVTKTRRNEDHPSVKVPLSPISQIGDPLLGDVWVGDLISPELGGPDGNQITEGCYPITVELFNDPDEGQGGPATVKAFVDIYKKSPGQEVTIYETSFEDNFANYNEWIQVDADCGIIGGQYDSWTWTDARANCGDYSFKNTMYDVYKGNQDDFLELTKTFNVASVDTVKVVFDIWVEGDYGEHPYYAYYMPYDFLEFEIGNGIGSWINPLGPTGNPRFLDEQLNLWPGSYYFMDTTMPIYNNAPTKSYMAIAEDLGNGWWEITYEVDPAALPDDEHFQFRFGWHSDPQFQYEGAYVDCVKIIGIEDTEVKVDQMHSQGAFVIQEGCTLFTFPLNYCFEGSEDKGVCYDLKVWLEAIDPDHETLNDWGVNGDEARDFKVCVEDWYDVEVVAGSLEIETSVGAVPVYPGSGIMQHGDDAHIMATIHADGTLPVSDVVVTANAYKIISEQEYFSDFESGPGWEYGSFGDPSLWHITSTDAWSGSKALACFDKTTNHYHNNMYVDYALGPTVDMQGATDMTLNYYTKFISQGSTDLCYILTCGQMANYQYTLGNGMGFNCYGYNPEWMGAMQPLSKYKSFDLVAAYNYWHDVRGMFVDQVGDQVYDLQVGFAIWGTNANIYTHPSAEANGEYWSGWYFDDVEITSKKISETPIWTQTIIVPGPLEPCETADVQFEWEDVPYCNYLIKITTNADGACGNLEDDGESAKILVVTDLEMAHPKEVEFIDYTELGDCNWGICSSDTDNYLATNNINNNYNPDEYSIIQLCPDGDKAIDISSLFGGAGVVPVTFLSEAFSGAGIPSGWTTDDWSVYLGEADLYWLDILGDYSFLDTPVMDTSAASTLTLDFDSFIDDYLGGYTCKVLINDGGGWDDITPWANPISGNVGPGTHSIDISAYISSTMQIEFEFDGYYLDIDDWYLDNVVVSGDVSLPSTPPTSLLMTFDAWWELDYACDYVFVQVANYPVEHETDWHTVASFNGESYSLPEAEPADGWIYGINVNLLNGFVPEETVEVRFLFTSDNGWEFRGMMIDDLAIAAINFGPDAMNNMNNWCCSDAHVGNYWEFVDPEWCITFPAVAINNALIWETEIADSYEAFLALEHEYVFASGAEGRIQLSADGGDSWYTLGVYTGSSSGYKSFFFDITPWAGSHILIRFIVTGNGAATGHWCIRNMIITGKEDTGAPSSTMTMSGTMVDGWYSSAVSCKITATDDASGVKEIHYILDGKETVVAGATASFTVSGNGVHNIEFWAIDNTGNVETPHNTVPAFRIDAGAPPSVSITGPEPGLYLFGNKLLSLSKVFIIGAFDITATASDAESGVYSVKFYLDGDLIGEKTEAPFSVYCAVKHTGAGTIKVVASDFSGNTAEDTLDITYYKFL